MSPAGVEARPSPIQGLGLFATRAFAAGERLVAYTGRPCSAPPAHEPGKPVYALELRPGLWLDGDTPDNLARHANHSCRPNAELVCPPDSAEAWLIASGPIPKGAEITFDYGFSLADSLLHPCRCGQPDCVGRIIAAPLRPALLRHLRFSRPRY
jgi:SET domain-containing protein